MIVISEHAEDNLFELLKKIGKQESGKECSAVVEGFEITLTKTSAAADGIISIERIE